MSTNDDPATLDVDALAEALRALDDFLPSRDVSYLEAAEAIAERYESAAPATNLDAASLREALSHIARLCREAFASDGIAAAREWKPGVAAVYESWQVAEAALRASAPGDETP